ncbi:hypothetical protein [Flammeovirga kamogawensis]|uniref:DUF3244 domain-containing protein n=1 Tax=Flammeovirga kamogawensis TaxID=373891 RepID=A0ABX8GW49_9BACT|nr:hypothetical protein [Flammeovirga kamogawensis]MBB6459767.1 hypothetical protein [Flammeovirga kamogawensis]QWG07175.1 hypothetical protein KM029_18015 [Flammeovirga kamogawensis]TRX68996.1 hypothetical protein EO216_13005 [Flammeovirga kamogawensis]
MKHQLKNLVTLLFLFISPLVLGQNAEEPYPLLSSFVNQGGKFEDKIQLFIVEFGHTSEVKVHVTYRKNSGELILSFKDKSGSFHEEVLKDFYPITNQETPSVVTFYKKGEKAQSVSITEYAGGLSVLWNGIDYHMSS